MEKEIAVKPWAGRFQAMGCPCEILLNTADPSIGREQWEMARQEAQRIEQKYSRYISGNIVDRINHSQGQRVEVDEETAALFDYAAQCFEISAGLFDITTGALRRGPDASRVGWNRVVWQNPFITLPPGAEIDLGGICKEYAADQILRLLTSRHRISTLVNLGGDISAAGERLWSIGIEDVLHAGQVARAIHVRRGGVATSGTTKRGGHILNPQTGMPMENAPLSITVAAKTCTEAGFWSTLGILHGADAERFLDENHLEYWCYRSAANLGKMGHAPLDFVDTSLRAAPAAGSVG